VKEESFASRYFQGKKREMESEPSIMKNIGAIMRGPKQKAKGVTNISGKTSRGIGTLKKGEKGSSSLPAAILRNAPIQSREKQRRLVDWRGMTSNHRESD